MSEDTIEPGSLEFKMNTAVLSMNRKLREQGYNERERAFMWGMTVGEMREFLTTVWEHTNNDKQHIDSLSESSARVKNAERTAQLSATAAVKELVDQNPKLDPDEIKKIKVEQLGKARNDTPKPPKPGPPVKTDKPVQTNSSMNENPTCPECKAGKHENCDATALDEESDRFVQCQCWIDDHKPV